MCKQFLSLSGYVKVKLTYRSSVPHTAAALTLQKLGVGAPYAEDIRILVPTQAAFSALSAYRDAFEILRLDHIVPTDAILTDFAFDDENEQVLAYVASPQ